MRTLRILTAFVVLFLGGVSHTFSFTHEKLPVNFLEYTERAFELARKENKPVFMLISAVWCHWCHVFEEGALSSEKVYSYLNEHYINVFVDADIRRDLHFRFQATALPYVVFLKPDGSTLHKYGGVLNTNDFLELLKILHKKAALSEPEGDVGDESAFSYSPPSKLETENIEAIQSLFTATFLDNFDEEESGMGGGRKFLLPNTFIYLFDNLDNKENDFPGMIDRTLKKAVGGIYDSVEGGFFRYAETRDWKIPHYEKMLNVNSAALLLLLKADAASPSDKLKDAVRGTIEYLSSILFDSGAGVFMSFQIADTSYYSLSAEQRKKVKKPAVIKKVFVDTLSVSLGYLLDASSYLNNPAFNRKIKQSVEFLLRMVKQENKIYHYYYITDGKWFLTGSLADHAHLALLFSKAYKAFKNPDYLRAAEKILDDTYSRYYNAKFGVYQERPAASLADLEYFMDLNSVIAQALLITAEFKPDKGRLKIVERMLNYFSGMKDLLAERAWEARDFGFLEVYARYLTVVKLYVLRVSL